MSSRRNKLNKKQIHLLRVINKFRFVTSDLVARFKNVSRTSVNYSFEVLRDQGLIDRKYNSKFKLQGKGAIYFLTPKAIKLLRDKGFNLDDRILKTTYKNKIVSDEFVELCLSVMEAYLGFRATYGHTFELFSRSELYNPEILPKPPSPSLYLRRNRRSETKKYEYFLDVINDTRFFIYKQRIQAYVDHEYEGDWPGDEKYPNLLLVCPTDRVEKRVNRHIYTLLEDFDIYTTTMDRLINSDNQKIWIDIFEQEDDEPTVFRGL
jgi:DNA-binding transcriptional ArsR family regulator